MLGGGLPCGQQGPNFFTPQLLPLRLCVSKKLEQKVKLGLKPGYSKMDAGVSRGHLTARAIDASH